jgi:HlyD family secretion protein
MQPATVVSGQNIRAKLGIEEAVPGRHRRLRTWAIRAGVLVVVAAAAVALWSTRSQEPTVQYRTEQIRRGSLTITVTATGALEPLTQVNVGTEISGIIEAVAVDDNDRVRAGQVLARVNTDKLAAQATQARAALAVAEARLRQARETAQEARTTLSRLERIREASRGQLVTQQELDAARAAFNRAEADEAIAAAQITQSKASLAAIQTDLGKAIIRSPIDGIVLDRQVDPGQTVAASFQTPVLFALAQDLSRMKLGVAVDEADVGGVRAGQEATFTVDAYPGRTFVSQVLAVGNMAQTVSGVVTYEAQLSVDNKELLLRPGMTATAVITVTHLADALLVPNVAFRFVPPAQTEETDTETETGRRGGLLGTLMPRPPRFGGGDETGPSARQRVWVLRDGEPVQVELGVGATDGTLTQVVSGDLAPGDLVIIDAVTGTT